MKLPASFRWLCWKLSARPRRPKPPKPRTRAKRIAAAAGGFAIVLALLFGYGYCFGGPVSRYLSGRIAARYVEEHHPGETFLMDNSAPADTGYRYIITMQSADSQDTRFVIWVEQGRVTWDSYEERVSQLINTRARLGEQLRHDVTAALAAAGMEAPADTSYWMVVGGTDSSTGIPAAGHPPFALDMPYDKGTLPPFAIEWEFTVGYDEVPDDPAASAAAWIGRAKSAMDAAGIDIAAYQVTFHGVDGSEPSTPARKYRVSKSDTRYFCFQNRSTTLIFTLIGTKYPYFMTESRRIGKFRRFFYAFFSMLVSKNFCILLALSRFICSVAWTYRCKVKAAVA